MVIENSIKLTLFAACTFLAPILPQRKAYATPTNDWLEMGKPVKMWDALKTEQALQDQFGFLQAAQESNFKYYNTYDDLNFLPIQKSI